jgi:Lon-like protease
MLSRQTRARGSGWWRQALRVPMGPTVVALGPSWLLVAPAGLWAIATAYVGVLGAYLGPAATWAVALSLLLLVGVSLVVHVLAHAWAARWLGGEAPSPISLYPWGDAAQVWPAGASPWREALAAIAGPVANLALAGVAFLLWNAQLNGYLNVSMPFFGGFNIGLAALNLAPAFPFDGGRLLRVILWGLLGRPAAAARLAMSLGFLIAGALGVWGIILFAQRVRFSLETGAATLVCAVLIAAALLGSKAWQWDRPRPQNVPPPAAFAIRAAIAVVLTLALLAVPTGLAPDNRGLQAPGLALGVEPMVEVPPAYAHPHAGSFILTSVIEQAPIILAEWAVAQVNPAYRIVPPQEIYPANTSPQEQARQGFQMLDESTITASVVGLRLAGYDVPAEGKGAVVTSILPDSPSRQLLKPGDIITAVGSHRVQTTADLIHLVAAQAFGGSVRLEVQRDGRPVQVDAPLMPPAQPGGTPRLGITIESAGLDYTLPFPVRIVPQKIVGGPSAGLMFTLTLYNALTPDDLTGGRKIAGTGTISLDGTVGPIGGVEQKVAAAESAGAEYFLSPPENYAAAASVAHRIKVIEVATVEQAVAFLRDLPPVAEH